MPLYLPCSQRISKREVVVESENMWTAELSYSCFSIPVFFTQYLQNQFLSKISIVITLLLIITNVSPRIVILICILGYLIHMEHFSV